MLISASTVIYVGHHYLVTLLILGFFYCCLEIISDHLPNAKKDVSVGVSIRNHGALVVRGGLK